MDTSDGRGGGVPHTHTSPYDAAAWAFTTTATTLQLAQSQSACVRTFWVDRLRSWLWEVDDS